MGGPSCGSLAGYAGWGNRTAWLRQPGWVRRLWRPGGVCPAVAAWLAARARTQDHQSPGQTAPASTSPKNSKKVGQALKSPG